MKSPNELSKLHIDTFDAVDPRDPKTNGEKAPDVIT